MVEICLALGEKRARPRVFEEYARAMGSGAVLGWLCVPPENFWGSQRAPRRLSDRPQPLPRGLKFRPGLSRSLLPRIINGADTVAARRHPLGGSKSVEFTKTDTVISEELISMLGKQIIGSAQSSDRQDGPALAAREIGQKVAGKAQKNLDLQDPRTFYRLQQMVRKVCPTWLEREKDDLAQKAMIRLLELEQRVGTENREICASYLYRTVLSTVIDEIRKRKREVLANDVEDYRVDAADHAKNEELQSSNNPLGKLRAAKLRAAILDCLARLNEERRRATSLRLQGFSNLEISKLLGWKPKKAENMALRGRLDLRKCLSKKGYQVQC